MDKNFLQKIPKVELHLHIEGTLEPELMFSLAARNKIKLPYNSIDEVRQAYNFQNLQSFLDLYYQGMQVLQTEQDFYDLTFAYLTKVSKENVRHVEMFFDPQAHTSRGVAFETIFNGIQSALQTAEKELGISTYLIACFLRHLPEDEAFITLEQLLPYKDKIIGVGLDSSEVGNPPEKFKNVFKEALRHGFHTVAHAGEEGGSENIWQTIELFQPVRIDHGVQAINDEKLLDHLVETQLPLTVCPLSNIKLCVFSDMQLHPLKKLLNRGVCVTVNSDDPAYFGGYMLDNYQAISEALGLTKNEIVILARNSINASLLPLARKNELLSELEALC